MTPIDPEYKTTKPIKKGEVSLSREFIDLANWIDQTYEVKVLNIIYDTLDNSTRPRLVIILDNEKDSQKIRSLFGFGTSRQLEMSLPFIKLISERLPKHKTENIRIVITSFESPAKDEARWAISKDEIANLESELNLKELWKVYIGVDTVTFFFFTNAQVQQYSTDASIKYLTGKYFDLLKPHDEFGYYQESDLSIELESKENFETKYENSWFSYDRS